MKYDAIIVGGGIAGLTSAAFLVKNGHKVLLCEKEYRVGGLISSFNYEGFLFDAGARGIVDSGIVKPMLAQLGINVDFVKSIVSIGIEDEMIRVETKKSLEDYRRMLIKHYPGNESDIDLILEAITSIMDYMDVLYGIENPLFMDLKDRKYVFKKLLPWVVRFIKKSGKLEEFKIPVEEYLSKLSDNQSLIDLISQHFFQKTPTSFALSYFSLYLDYEYPKMGTYELIDKIKDYIIQHDGVIKTDTRIERIDSDDRTIYDQHKNEYKYEQLIWAADTNQLYKAINTTNAKDMNEVENQKSVLASKKGIDSVFSIFMGVDLDSDYFRKKASGHVFYTPSKKGQSAIFDQLDHVKNTNDKKAIIDWMLEYLDYTTYEIAIPALRNEELAPKGKTGLIVSFLMDYEFIKNIKTLGFYKEFKELVETKAIAVLDDGIYKGIKDKVLFHFASSPLTIERLSGNYEGAITGWAFINETMPSVNKATEITKACITPIANILQAGQWTFSPSGLPISILTGKIAADKANKVLKKRKRQ
ncbi:MAG: NAD(P)/FAD-dependent oxidoreductase [Erysipelotrichaceae bacterium]|nr:NAD(P)/FAD-dependent oxidoreductase [Erysipelotrichaceae bacterium]